MENSTINQFISGWWDGLTLGSKKELQHGIEIPPSDCAASFESLSIESMQKIKDFFIEHNGGIVLALIAAGWL